MRLASPVGWRFGGAIADNAGIYSAPRKFSAQTAEFDFGATVHHDFQACRLGLLRRRIIPHAQLHPYHLGTDGDGVIDDRADLVGRPEHVDHVDLVGNVAQRGVDTLAQLVFTSGAGVDRDNAVAFALQVLHYEI